MDWFLTHRPDLAEFMTFMESSDSGGNTSGL